MKNHYFKNTDLEHQIIIFNDTVCGNYFKFTTDKGIFSKDHVDHLTKTFLDVIINVIDPNSVLDFGCGYGVIGMCVSKYHNVCVDMLDINERAVNLAKLNVEQNNLNANVFISNMFERVENKYSSILLNPPIHAGKKTCYNIYEQAKYHLVNKGSLYIVISKKHGAKSTIDFLNSIYESVDILYKKKAVYVIKAN
ncbi:MAG: class I SAM-dependent methyltransferase [Bacilli bacterium]